MGVGYGGLKGESSAWDTLKNTIGYQKLTLSALERTKSRVPSFLFNFVRSTNFPGLARRRETADKAGTNSTVT